MIAGLIGGVIAALGVAYLLRADTEAKLAALRAEVTAPSAAGDVDQLAARIEALEAAPGVDQLTQRVDALEQAEGGSADLIARVEALEAAGGTASAEAIGTLTSRIEALEATGGTGSADAITTLASRVDALETAFSGSAQAPALAARIDVLEGAFEQTMPKLGGMDERLAAVEGRVAGVDSVATDLGDRLAAMETQLATVATAGGGDTTAGAAPGGAAAAALDGRLDSLEASLGEAVAASATNGDRLSQVEDRLAAVDGAVSGLTALPAQTAALEQELTTSRQRTGELGDRVDGVADQVGQLGQQMGTLTTAVDALGQRTDALTSDVGDLGQRLDAAAEAEQRAAALALVTAQLGTAISQEQPYEQLMPSLQGIGAGDPVIDDASARLAPSAAEGVPSMAELRDQLAAIAAEIVHSDRAPEGQDMLSEAAGSLLRLVTVRPVGGDVEGDSAAARVARAEAKLAAGDLAGAVGEIEQLSGPAAATAAPWLEDAKRRLDAEQALASLQTRATDLLSRAP